MPVDPLEEALATDLEVMSAFFRKLSQWKPGDPMLTSGDGVRWANTCAQAAALIRRILAELDRRSPPTGEEGGALEKLIALIKQTPANLWYVDAEDPERVVCDAADALAAAPPPPDVSRGLDREEVAGLLRKTWHDFRYPPLCAPRGPEDADVFDYMALALSAGGAL